jgi:membrane fusion protein, multidrug efflux system
MPPLFTLPPLRRKAWIKRLRLLSPSILLGLLTVSFFLFSGCSSEKKVDPAKARRDRTVPVTVSPVMEKTIPVQIKAIGNVEAYATVSIKSRVGGELKQVSFQGGQDVKKGELLFIIDPDPYEAALKQSQANLAKSVALLKKAEEDRMRYADLVQKEYISQEQYDQARTNADALKAQIKADQAAVDNARLQVGYCTIRAPLSGRTGDLLADKGNMIKAQDDNKSLVIINQIQPIYISFAVPEQDLGQIKKYAAAGQLKLKALVPKDGEYPEEGGLSFMDNTVDKATGTIKLKGTFANKERRLWPGQFVNVVLDLTTQSDALVVPSQALQTGLEGQYVFIVRPNLTAETRPVVIGRPFNGQTVIEKGVQAGEKVVTDGQFQLITGTKVQIKNELESKGATRP